jgi:hypothetical protein
MDAATEGATDADLGLARGGDDAAFTRLVEPLRRELHAHCYRMLGSAHDADDALQEALLRAWRGLARFEGRSSLRSWLYTVATRTCLDVIEHRGYLGMAQTPSHCVTGGDRDCSSLRSAVRLGLRPLLVSAHQEHDDAEGWTSCWALGMTGLTPAGRRSRCPRSARPRLFNDSLRRAGPACHRESVRAAECQLSTSRTTVN